MRVIGWIVLILLGLSLFGGLLYVVILIRPRKRGNAPASLLCPYAHRGLHGAQIPENSLSAFSRALACGVGIELDVQLSRDGVVMVFHDETLIRMTGCDQRLCELEAAELQALSLHRTSQTIPTFKEVLSLVDGRVPLLVELKGESFDTSLCQKVAELLAQYKGNYCIESFNPLLLRKMRYYLPDAFYGLLYTNVCREKKRVTPLNVLLTAMAFNALARPDFIAYDKQDRNSRIVRLVTGLYHPPRFVWTVCTDEELELAHALGECPIFEKPSS